MRRDLAWAPVALAAVAMAVPLVAPTRGEAAVVMGSSLLKPAITTWGCGATPCTGVQASLPGSGLVTVSPVNGTITKWGVRGATGTDTGRLRVLIPNPNGSYTFTGTSATETVPGGTAVSTFTTSLPIAEGDLIGLDDDHAGGSSFGDAGGTAGSKLIFQPIPLNGPPVTPFVTGPGELLFNAEVVPANRFPKPKQPKSTPRRIDVLIVQVPNSGFLSARNVKGGDLIQPIRKTVAGAAFVKLKLKPSRASRAALRRLGSVRDRIRVTFLPTGGSPFSRTTRVTLRKI